MLTDRIQADLKDAMRSRDAARVRTLRSIRAAIQHRQIEDRMGAGDRMTDDHVVSILQKQAKQRRDSIDQFQAAGREDLVQIEREELEIITEYLPKQLADGEISDILREVVQEVGAESMSDIGKVMGPAMARLRGKADGRRVNEIARSLLSQH